MLNRHDINFPQQRVSAAEKKKAEWYSNCIDYVIAAGLACNDRTEDETLLSIQRGNIPDSFYKKTLNPYNSNKEKYKRFPATMRNLDIMTDIIRRYVSEYYKGVHEFTVGADNPDIVINKNNKLKEQIGILAQQAFQAEFEKNYQQMVEQAQQQGQDPKEIDPQQAMPDLEAFIKAFNEKYIDDESKQGQDMLNYIRHITSDNFIYLSAFFNFVSLGHCYTYTDIRGDQIIKECVPVLEAYPVPNTNFFVEDYDMFARKMLMSYQQIMDTFDDVLTKEDRKFLEEYYAKGIKEGKTQMLSYTQMFENYPDVCGKFSKEERELFRQSPVSICETNNNLYEVWHVVWRGEARQGILTYINEVGLTTTRIVDESYKLNPEMGDISIEWVYEPQVYEGYRIGTRYTSIYPIKARPIAFNRKGKLPYNGIQEVLPYMGKFSIIKTITPYQIMRNIFAYHREMVIAKNKMLILMMPESLIASDTEDKIYKMAADGVLIVDDEDDSAGTKMQHVRMLNASLGDYITQLTNLLEAIKLEAREMVDMNLQRYGDITNSAGVGTTREAIARSSMGMVILVTMFDEMRKRDYNRDLDYAKLAYINGLDTAYWNILGQRTFISLDVNSFINSDYSTIVNNDPKDKDKLEQLRQWAFSAAQNGDLDMALAAITGDNVTQIKSTIDKFTQLKQQHEADMKQADQMLKQEELQSKLQQIEAKGVQDRLTEELKYNYEIQLKYMDVDVSMLGDNVALEAKRNIDELTAQNKLAIEQGKLQVARAKVDADLYNAAADRQVKREELKTQLQIAKTNKNKYDK